jgi:hypothetical protein
MPTSSPHIRFILVHLNVILLCPPRYSKRTFSLTFPHKNSACIFCSFHPSLVACPALLAVVQQGSCYITKCVVIWSSLDPDVLLSVSFTSLHFFLALMRKWSPPNRSVSSGIKVSRHSETGNYVHPSMVTSFRGSSVLSPHWANRTDDWLSC